MRLFHTPRTSFLLTERLWKHTSCTAFIFIPGKTLRAPSTAFLNSPLRLCLYEIKTRMKNFNGFSLPIAVLVFTCGWWRQEVLCVIQSLPLPDFGCHTICWKALSPKHPLSRLMVQDLNEKHFHVGREHILALVRKQFWIPRRKSFTRKIVNDCL